MNRTRSSWNRSARFLASVLFLAGCSAQVVGQTPCSSNADCAPFGVGSTCQADGYCTDPVEVPLHDGVSSSMVRTVGIADISGSLRDLGGGMNDGVRSAFDAYNRANPSARHFVHEVRDDMYLPAQSVLLVDEVTRDPGTGEGRYAFAIVGSMGSPTSSAMLPTINERQVPFFGTYSGATHLRRDPPDRVVWNTRASYRAEGTTITNHLLLRDPNPIPPGNIFAFSQSPVALTTEGLADASEAAAATSQTVLDAYGNSGYLGIVDALAPALGSQTDIPLGTYRATGTNTTIAEHYFFQWVAGLAPRDLGPSAVGGTLRIGIAMVPVASAATPFIRGVIDGMNQLRMGQKPDQLTAEEWAMVAAPRITELRTAELVITSISPVGDQLVANLLSAGAGEYCTTEYPILVSQVVPFPTGGSAGAVQFREDLRAYDVNLRPGFVNFEGWVAGRVWVEAVLETEARGALTVDALIETLSDPTFSVELGIGPPIQFLSGHDGSRQVFGSSIDTGCVYQEFTFAHP